MYLYLTLDFILSCWAIPFTFGWPDFHMHFLEVIYSYPDCMLFPMIQVITGLNELRQGVLLKQTTDLYLSSKTHMCPLGSRCHPIEAGWRIFIYINELYINRVYGREQMSSGGNTSSNPQVSALLPRPAVNRMERMCQRHGGDQTPYHPVVGRVQLTLSKRQKTGPGLRWRILRWWRWQQRHFTE